MKPTLEEYATSTELFDVAQRENLDGTPYRLDSTELESFILKSKTGANLDLSKLVAATYAYYLLYQRERKVRIGLFSNVTQFFGFNKENRKIPDEFVTITDCGISAHITRTLIRNPSHQSNHIVLQA